MIRFVIQNDAQSVTDIAIASGLFAEEDSAFLEQMMADYFGDNLQRDHRAVISEDEQGKPVGVAYYEPALATDGTWYLTMIAVRAEVQGQGHGAALTRFVEDDLQMHGQRVLLVETSGLPEFALTRQFYAKCGYGEEARIRDYYAPGEDMVVFRKVLNAT